MRWAFCIFAVACFSLATYGIYVMLAEPATALRALHTMGFGG